MICDLVQKVKMKIRKGGDFLLTAEQKEKARQARNQYAREWRAKNKDKVKASNARYWERQAQKLMDGKEEENGVEDAND